MLLFKLSFESKVSSMLQIIRKVSDSQRMLSSLLGLFSVSTGDGVYYFTSKLLTYFAKILKVNLQHPISMSHVPQKDCADFNNMLTDKSWKVRKEALEALLPLATENIKIIPNSE